MNHMYVVEAGALLCYALISKQTNIAAAGNIKCISFAPECNAVQCSAMCGVMVK